MRQRAVLADGEVEAMKLWAILRNQANRSLGTEGNSILNEIGAAKLKMSGCQVVRRTAMLWHVRSNEYTNETDRDLEHNGLDHDLAYH